MSNRDYEYQEIGSLSVHEFRQLMRECLAEQNTKPEPEAEPVAWIVETELQDGSYNRWVCMDKKRYKEHHDSPNPIIPLYTRHEAEAEPVAWYHPSGDGYDSNFRDHEVVKSCTGNPWTGWIPLYTGPEPVREPMSFRLLGLISELTVGNS